MKVHELIDKPEKWLKNFLASCSYANEDHSPKGSTIEPEEEDAVSFCVYGGIIKVCRMRDDLSFTQQQNLIDETLWGLEKTLGTCPIDWNNSPDLTFEEFHRVLVEADV